MLKLPQNAHSVFKRERFLKQLSASYNEQWIRTAVAVFWVSLLLFKRRQIEQKAVVDQQCPLGPGAQLQQGCLACYTPPNQCIFW